MAEYRYISLNLCSRTINIDEERLSKIQKDIEYWENGNDLDNRIQAKILKRELEIELLNYKYYRENKSNKNIRRMVFTESESITSTKCLFTDTFHTIVDKGLANYDISKPYLNIYDFSKRLDICLAVAFDIDYRTIAHRLKMLCSKYHISLETLSRIFLVCSADISDDICFNIGDIFDLSNNISSYVKELIGNSYKKSVPILDLIDVKANMKKFFPTIYAKHNSQEILLALRLQIAYKMMHPVIDAMLKYQDSMGADALIFSKHLFGFTMNSSSMPTDDIYINLKNDQLIVPCEIYEWKKGVKLK